MILKKILNSQKIEKHCVKTVKNAHSSERQVNLHPISATWRYTGRKFTLFHESYFISTVKATFYGCFLIRIQYINYLHICLSSFILSVLITPTVIGPCPPFQSYLCSELPLRFLLWFDTSEVHKYYAYFKVYP